MERSKILKSFEMSLNDGWEMNFIENADGSKTIEIGTEGVYPVHVHFGYDKITNMRWVEVIDALINPEIPNTTTRWEA